MGHRRQCDSTAAVRRGRVSHATRATGGSRNQRGFTLSELVVSMTVLGIIIVPLTTAAMTFVKSGADTVPMYESSASARLVDNWFRRDAQSAESVDSGSSCATGTTVVNLRWSDDRGASVASYAVVTAASTRSFVRHLCANGSLSVTSTLVRDLGANTPSYSCDPDCDAPDTITLDVRDANGYRFADTVAVRVQAA